MVTLVIPVYNEAAIAADTVRQAEAFLRAHFDRYELLIVDDGSTDGTADIVRSLENDCVHLLGYTPNAGKGCAIRTGMLAAKGDYVFYTDADLAYGLDVVAEGFAILEDSGSDLVLGSRKLDPTGYAGYPLIRKLASKTFSILTRLFTGLPYDCQCGFKGFRREAGAKIFQLCRTNGFSFDFEALLIARHFCCTVSQMPVTIVNHRDSKVNVLRDSFRMLRDLLRIRADLAHRLKDAE